MKHSQVWRGLYNQDAKYAKCLDPATNAHPAKMPIALTIRIIRYLESEGLIHKGQTIVDCMAGTARTGVAAELEGYKFLGIELESHFICMQEQNRKALKAKIHREPSWTLIQDDARHLSELLQEKHAGIISPPYAHAKTHPHFSKDEMLDGDDTK